MHIFIQYIFVYKCYPTPNGGLLFVLNDSRICYFIEAVLLSKRIFNFIHEQTNANILSTSGTNTIKYNPYSIRIPKFKYLVKRQATPVKQGPYKVLWVSYPTILVLLSSIHSVLVVCSILSSLLGHRNDQCCRTEL